MADNTGAGGCGVDGDEQNSGLRVDIVTAPTLVNS